MRWVFWDIDGTLLTTARGGVYALEDACREVTGRELDLQAIKSDGLTDHQLAVRILEQAGVEPSPEVVERFLRHYELQLPARLPLRQGRVLDNVREVLTDLRTRQPSVRSVLLTGNTSAGARAKLTHYGLWDFFEDGTFSEDAGPRTRIAERALARARAQYPHADFAPSRLFVVGDTPHDIACADAIGARSIAVATGVFSADALRAHGAWAVFDRLPDPAAFGSLIGSDGGGRRL